LEKQAMHDTALSEMLRQFITIPLSDEESRQLRECLVARQADVREILVSSAEAEDRLLAASAIAQLDLSQADLVLPELMEGLKSRNEADRVCAAIACENLGPVAAPAVPALLEVLTNHDDHDDGNEIARNRALGALEAIGPAAARAVPALIELLHGAGLDSSAVKITDAISSAAALGAIGPSADAGLLALRECLNLDGAGNDLIRWLRLTASEAIWRISNVTVSALSIATEMLLGDEEWWLRYHAANLLGKLGPAARPVIMHLQRCRDDEDENVRGAARKAWSVITQDHQ
jgi:hypothetical protein